MTATYQEQIEEELQRFVEFGGVLDLVTRKYLAQYLRQKLDPRQPLPDLLSSAYYRYFCQALDRIFSSQPLLDLIRRQPVISREVTTEVLQWIRRAHRRVADANPFFDEFQRLEALSVMPLREFLNRWQVFTAFLSSVYGADELPAAFYSDRFDALIGKKSIPDLSADDLRQLEELLADLLAQWDALLQAKRLEYELNKLEEEEETPFAERLEQMAVEYQKLFDLISPFSETVGRYWDMSRGLWEDAGFDVLSKYRDLLEDEPSLRELADLLGRMREAELITEEETIERVIVRQDWLEQTAERAEIAGIHESDDLSYVLSQEVGLLGNEDTETAFFKKFAEKDLLTFRFQHEELRPSPDRFTEVSRKVRRKEKGPFIVCMDTSDSMSGEPERLAKVLCFGILRMAAQENRRAYLINFSVGVKTIDLFDIGRSLDDIVAFLRMSFHSGTDMTLALHEVFRQLESPTYRDADVLVVSDFILYRLEPEEQARIRYHQQHHGVQFHSLVLSDRPNEEVLRLFDTNWLYDPGNKGIVRDLSKHMREKFGV